MSNASENERVAISEIIRAAEARAAGTDRAALRAQTHNGVVASDAAPVIRAGMPIGKGGLDPNGPEAPPSPRQMAERIARLRTSHGLR